MSSANLLNILLVTSSAIIIILPSSPTCGALLKLFRIFSRNREDGGGGTSKSGFLQVNTAEHWQKNTESKEKLFYECRANRTK